MRETRDGKFHYTKKGRQLRGITFGYDTCAEQELGLEFWHKFIKKPHLRKYKKVGLKGRQWNQIPDLFKWIEVGEWAGFIYTQYEAQVRYQVQQREQYRSDDENFFAWDYEQFAVLTKNKKNQQHLRKLYELALDKKVCFAPADFFEKGTGMCIANPQYITAELKEQEEEDQGRLIRAEAWEKSAAKRYLDDFQRRVREQEVRSCYYPGYLGPSNWSRGPDDDGKWRWWLNDSRIDGAYGAVTDEEAIEYLKRLEQEFGVQS